MTEREILISCVCGSVRPGNYTGKALALVIDELTKQPGVKAVLVDPTSVPLSMPGIKSSDPALRTFQQLMRDSVGVVLATPEYHGGMSSVIKLVIENLGFPSGLKDKPVALLGVASGSIGAIKATEQLRTVCAHVGALVLPGNVSVARVDKVFDSDGRCLDAAIEKRIRGLAESLVEYIRRAVCPAKSIEQMARE